PTASCAPAASPNKPQVKTHKAAQRILVPRNPPSATPGAASPIGVPALPRPSTGPQGTSGTAAARVTAAPQGNLGSVDAGVHRILLSWAIPCPQGADSPAWMWLWCRHGDTKATSTGTWASGSCVVCRYCCLVRNSGGLGATRWAVSAYFLVMGLTAGVWMARVPAAK